MEIRVLSVIAVTGETLAPRCTTGGASGGGTTKTGVAGVFVLEVSDGFSGVINVVDVVTELRPSPLWVLPLAVLPDVPFRVPSSDPPPPNEDVGVGEKTGAVPRKAIWI